MIELFSQVVKGCGGLPVNRPYARAWRVSENPSQPFTTLLTCGFAEKPFTTCGFALRASAALRPELAA